jgi:hypothetical protein
MKKILFVLLIFAAFKCNAQDNLTAQSKAIYFEFAEIFVNHYHIFLRDDIALFDIIIIMAHNSDYGSKGFNGDALCGSSTVMNFYQSIDKFNALKNPYKGVNQKDYMQIKADYDNYMRSKLIEIEMEEEKQLSNHKNKKA